MGSFSESQTWDVVDICIWNAKRDKIKRKEKVDKIFVKSVYIQSSSTNLPFRYYVAVRTWERFWFLIIKR